MSPPLSTYFSSFSPPVSRVVAESTTLEMDLSLDVATDIYPVASTQSFSLQLVSTLHPGGEAESGDKKEVWRDGAGGLAEEWDYVMYGKVSGVSVSEGEGEGESSESIADFRITKEMLENRLQSLTLFVSFLNHALLLLP